MRKGLFRKEAIDHQSTAISGRLLMTPKPAFMLLAALLMAWLLVVIVFLMHGSYARKTSVQGWLEPNGGVYKLYADSRGGQISELFVLEGQYVERGTSLLKISYGGKNTFGDPISEKLLKELEEKRKRTQGIIDRLHVLQSAALYKLDVSLSHAQKEQVEFNDIADITRSQYEVTRAHFEKTESLYHDGHVSHIAYQEQKLRKLSSEQQLKRAVQNLNTANNKISSLTQERASLPMQQKNELANYQNALSDLNHQIVTHNSTSEKTIYAPQDGIVSGLHIKPGYDIKGNNLLLTLVPQFSSMQAHMLVPVHSAGFIDEGQSLSIRYDAFPYQKFGMQSGSILRISKTLILPGELNDTPVIANQPAYLVTAELINETLVAYGEHIQLKAGMTFSADIELSQRTLIEWLLEPLYSLSGRL
ncbi:HlyD family secretion protein [Alteromonas sp. A081]|uniref:HlyD family secretion protein n=1 Tax=Alteromonas sp. A081 TaxID=3410269 RepID=UPI003B98025E